MELCAGISPCVRRIRYCLHKGGNQGFPPPLAVTGDAVLATMSPGSKGVAADVKYDGTLAPLARHIVYIIDESVRGDYIQLNNSRFDNTPYLTSLGGRVINFGVAISGANCSHASRTMLTFGTQPDEVFRKTNQPEPGLFQYAHRAGFRTIVVDAWKNMANYRDTSEQSAIDAYVPVTDDPPHVRDNRVAELLELLADDRPSIIYVSKFGVHFPYDMSDPSPTKSTSNFAIQLRAIGNLSELYNEAIDLNRRDELVNSYDKAIKWSVDGFFQTLLPRLDLSGTLLLYTSDHGQSMWEDGYKITHCSTTHPHPGESYVPLFVLTEIPSLADHLSESAARGFDRASHFDIFPTLLLAMGYNEKLVDHKFGQSLFDIPSMRHRKFLVGGSLGTDNWLDGANWATVQ